MLIFIDIKSTRLEDAGYAVGARVLELLCHRDKVWLLSEFPVKTYFIYVIVNKIKYQVN